MKRYISRDKRVLAIKKYLGERGWTAERVFWENIIVDIENSGDCTKINEWFKNKSTVYLQSWMEKYEKYSKITNNFDPLRHFNNVCGLDSAVTHIDGVENKGKTK